MKNVQITLDDQTLHEVDKIGKPLGLKRSAIVREALHDWLRRREIEGFERAWVVALRNRRDDAQDADAWIEAQAWSDK